MYALSFPSVSGVLNIKSWRKVFLEVESSLYETLSRNNNQYPSSNDRERRVPSVGHCCQRKLRTIVGGIDIIFVGGTDIINVGGADISIGVRATELKTNISFKPSDLHWA